MSDIQAEIKASKADWDEWVVNDSNKTGTMDASRPRNLTKPDLIRDHLCPDRSKVLLELGCGYGRETVLLASEFGKVVAWDISRKVIDLARKISFKSNIDYREWPEEAESHLDSEGDVYSYKADAVYSYGTMQCCVDDVALKLLSDAAKFTRKGGKLLIFFRVSAAPNYELGFESGKIQRKGNMVRVLRSPIEAKSLLERAGFIVHGYKDIYIKGVFMFVWLHGEKR